MEENQLKSCTATDDLPSHHLPLHYDGWKRLLLYVQMPDKAWYALKTQNIKCLNFKNVIFQTDFPS